MTSYINAPKAWVESLAKSGIFPPEQIDEFKLDLVNVLNSASRVSQWDKTSTGVITGSYVDPSGAVRIDADGMHIYNGTAETMWFKAIGDAFIGSNVAAAATTNFVFLSTDQTYNSESLGAGDLLIGDNSASKANMLWDASAGILYFRGGTTNQGWIDTTGGATFGAGTVVLDSTGITLANAAEVLYFLPVSGTAKASIGTTTYFGGRERLRIWHHAVRSVVTLSCTTTSSETPSLNLGEDGAQADRFQADFSLATQGSKITLGGEVQIGGWGASGGPSETFFNEGGKDIDFRVEGDTATNLLKLDAGLDAFQVGTTVAGAIADFRATSIVFNEASGDIDFRVESDGNANMFFVDGGADRLGIGTASPGTFLDVSFSNPVASIETNVTIQNTSTGDDDQVRLALVRGADDGSGLTLGEVIFAANADAGWADYQARNLTFWTGTSAGGATQRFMISAAGNIVSGTQSALAANATDGFLYIPTCAGAPTGTPTAYTGKVAVVFDATNNKLYIYDGGWIDVT